MALFRIRFNERCRFLLPLDDMVRQFRFKKRMLFVPSPVHLARFSALALGPARVQYILSNDDLAQFAGVSNAFKETGPDGTLPAETVAFAKRIDSTCYVVETFPNTKRRAAEVVSTFMGDKAEST